MTDPNEPLVERHTVVIIESAADIVRVTDAIQRARAVFGSSYVLMTTDCGRPKVTISGGEMPVGLSPEDMELYPEQLRLLTAEEPLTIASFPPGLRRQIAAFGQAPAHDARTQTVPALAALSLPTPPEFANNRQGRRAAERARRKRC
jgi:hypothetical protein